MQPVSYAAKLRDLTEGTLDPATFGHRDHIGVAYEALAREAFFDAARSVADGIRAMADRAGAPTKFNATITMAFLSLIAERMRTAAHRDADAFIDGNPDLADGSALRRLYSDGRLNSDLARSVALLPDRIAAGAAGP